MKNIYLLLLAAVLLGCDDEYDNHDNVDANSVYYEVTLEFGWNAQDFPVDYPSNPHFSPLVAWSHSSSADFFSPGTMASSGIQSMAETGSTDQLLAELDAKVDNGEGLCVILGSGLGNGSGSIKIEIEVSTANPMVSMATMVAPSPDWYAGAVNVNLLEDTVFVDRKVVDGLIYDSGTDDGITFTSGNVATNPQEAISVFVDAPLGDGVSVPVGFCQITFVRIRE